MLHIHTPTPNAVDYDAIVAVRNTVWTDDPTTVEQLRHFDTTWPAAYLSQRLLVEVDGNMVAAGHYVENTFQHPGWLPEGCFAAVASDGTWVGLTELSRTSALQHLSTPWTAVHPAYRRHGIATALNVRAIRFAHHWGAQPITTSNEANNPMYQLNLRLGFAPLPAALTMKKIF